MKFATIVEEQRDEQTVVVATPRQVSRLSDVCEAAGVETPHTVLALIERASSQPSLVAAIAGALPDAPSIDISGCRFCPPVPRPSKILGVAFNNKELMKMAHQDPGVPNFFMKPPSSLIGHGDAICIDPNWGAVIPEPEVCAIIGKVAKNLTDDDALEAVFGFSIMNDVTSHGLKFQKDSIAVTYPPDMAHPEFYQWRRLNGPEDRDVYYVYHTRSKGTDTFGPFGPWITTRDEIADPNALSVVASIDGDVFTRDSTANYRFSIQRCIAEASRYFTLMPGDIISFGTTGKGEGRYPRGHKSVLLGKFAGRIAIEVDGLGRLENDVRHFDFGAS